VLLGSGFFLLIWIVLWIAGFIDALTSESERVRVLPKTVWVILILIFSGFAAIAWFAFGRPRGAGAPGSRAIDGLRNLGSNAPTRGGAGGSASSGSGSGHPSTMGRSDDTTTGWQLGGAGGRRRSGPTAPDDDPDFLRSLGKRFRDERGGSGEGKPDQPA
jgi:hypothetical protein